MPSFSKIGCALFMAYSFLIFAEVPAFASSSDSKHRILIRPVPKSPNMPPRVPARVNVEAVYSDGVIVITFGCDQGLSNASVAFNGFEIQNIIFPTAAPCSINVGTAAGNYVLSISTADGHDYVGYLTLE